MWKACCKCGKIHDSNYQCNVGRIYRGDERKLRNKYSWAMKSQEIRERASYLCEVCKDQIKNQKYSEYPPYASLEVHHIEKLRDRPDLMLDNLNLVCLCQAHHKQADAGEIDIEYLRKLAMTREGV